LGDRRRAAWPALDLTIHDPDRIARLGAEGTAGVHPEVLRMGLREQSLIHGGCGKRDARGRQERFQLLLQSKARDQDRWKNRRSLCFGEPGQDGLDRGVEFPGFARERWGLRKGNTLDRCADDRHDSVIVRDRDVRGHALRQRGRDDAFHLADRVLRSEEHADTGRERGD